MFCIFNSVILILDCTQLFERYLTQEIFDNGDRWRYLTKEIFDEGTIQLGKYSTSKIFDKGDIWLEKYSMTYCTQSFSQFPIDSGGYFEVYYI